MPLAKELTSFQKEAPVIDTPGYPEEEFYWAFMYNAVQSGYTIESLK